MNWKFAEALKVAIPADHYGCLAVHHGLDDTEEYTISHVETGFGLGGVVPDAAKIDKRVARRVAEMLVDNIPDLNDLLNEAYLFRGTGLNARCKAIGLRLMAVVEEGLMMREKPLFIPLKANWFDAFERGDKDIEYRVYGPRWNENTCRVGRAVTLSRGYGKARRLSGVVSAFRVVGPDEHPAIRATYSTGDKFAAIEINVMR